ncbi:hypothetical protein EDB19DRAFT_1986555 [Suillus lakei]|nr:hypothetical protein EDB19DRAFT_1986555 [Suillus lakei]
MDTGICSGIDKAVVPWSAILQSQDDFVARKYLPADVDLKEPLKLQNWDTTALLNFWYAQQETGEGPTFLFKAWKNRDGDMVASVPRESLTKAKSDPESDTHHTEDNAGDDTANGRSPQKRPRRVPGPSSAHEVTAVPRSIPKPRPVKPVKTGAQQTSRMGDLLVGLTDAVTGDSLEDVAVEGGNTSPAPKNMWGKKAVIEPSARTTRNGALSFMMEATFQAD